MVDIVVLNYFVDRFINGIFLLSDMYKPVNTLLNWMYKFLMCQICIWGSVLVNLKVAIYSFGSILFPRHVGHCIWNLQE